MTLPKASLPASLVGVYGASADEYARALSIKNVKGTRLRWPRLLTFGDRLAFYVGCDGGTARRHDAAFLTVLRQGGLPDSEAAVDDNAGVNLSSSK